jgi:hypothetical protein
MVQDSSLGVIFTEPSGVKRAAGEGELFDGDIDMRTLGGIRAIEVRSLLFDVWRQYRKTVSSTYVYYYRPQTNFSFNPREVLSIGV